MSTNEKQEGKILEALPNGQFLIEVVGHNNPVRCYTSGKMRLHKIKMYVGDKVDVVLDDIGHIGRIIRRK